jgi:hypothetical protein
MALGGHKFQLIWEILLLLARSYVFLGVSTAVTMTKAVFWDVTQCGSCNNLSFGGTCALHHQGEENHQARNVSFGVLVASHC